MNTLFHRNRLPAILSLVLFLGGCNDGNGSGGNPPDSVDTHPDPISLAKPLKNIVPGLSVASSPIVVKGIDAEATIPAAVAGGLVAVNSDTEFVKGPIDVRLNDRIRVRADAPDEFSASHTATLTLGEGANAESADFILETGKSGFSVEPGLQSLSFEWGDMKGADHFELYENPDGVSGFTKVDLEIPGDATNATADIAPHLVDWNNARYQLNACNGLSGCFPVTGHETDVADLVNAFVPRMLKAFNADAGDQFGQSIALSTSGATMAIGAIGEDAVPLGDESDPAADGSANSGAVYVFTRIDGNWQQTFLKAATGDANDRFGFSVALNEAGTVLAVGAIGEASARSGEGEDDASDNNAANSGAAYLFRLVDGTWQQEAYLKAAEPDSDDSFGFSVALNSEGNIVAVGASNGDSTDPDTEATRPDTGTVHVFRHDGTSWTRQGMLSPGIADTGDTFGRAVSINDAGDVIAASAIGEDSNASGVNGDADNNDALKSGAVYVFRDKGGEWTQEAYIKAGNSGSDDQFGYTVRMDGSGNRLVASAQQEDSSTAGSDNTVINSGAVYVFDRTGNGWTQTGFLKAPLVGAGDVFGYSLDMSNDGEVMAVAAVVEDSAATGIGGDMQDNSLIQSGAAYVFRQAPSGEWRFVNYLKASNTGMNDFFGNAIALNGDGSRLASSALLEDSAIGADGNVQPENDDALDAGAVYVY